MSRHNFQEVRLGHFSSKNICTAIQSKIVRLSGKQSTKQVQNVSLGTVEKNFGTRIFPSGCSKSGKTWHSFSSTSFLYTVSAVRIMSYLQKHKSTMISETNFSFFTVELLRTKETLKKDWGFTSKKFLPQRRYTYFHLQDPKNWTAAGLGNY